MQSGPVYDLLHRIAYSLSFGEIPKVQLPSRNKQFNRFSLLQSQPFPLYCEDLFQGEHMHGEYKNYLLSRLGPALRIATRSDIKADMALIQGPAEYFVLTCPDRSHKLIYIGPYPHVIGLLPTQEQVDKAGKMELTSASPSTMSAQQLAKLRQTRRPYGDMLSN